MDSFELEVMLEELQAQSIQVLVGKDVSSSCGNAMDDEDVERT